MRSVLPECIVTMGRFQSLASTIYGQMEYYANVSTDQLQTKVRWDIIAYIWMDRAIMDGV